MRTLPTDSDERKRIPLYSGCVAYFPAALAGVAGVSLVRQYVLRRWFNGLRWGNR